MTNSSTCAGLSRRSMALGVLLLTVLGLGGTTCNRSLLTFSLVGGVQVTSHYLHYLVSSDGAGRGTTNSPRLEERGRFVATTPAHLIRTPRSAREQLL